MFPLVQSRRVMFVISLSLKQGKVWCSAMSYLGTFLCAEVISPRSILYYMFYFVSTYFNLVYLFRTIQYEVANGSNLGNRGRDCQFKILHQHQILGGGSSFFWCPPWWCCRMANVAGEKALIVQFLLVLVILYSSFKLQCSHRSVYNFNQWSN